jgi:hypothetical protein
MSFQNDSTTSQQKNGSKGIIIIKYIFLHTLKVFEDGNQEPENRQSFAK